MCSLVVLILLEGAESPVHCARRTPSIQWRFPLLSDTSCMPWHCLPTLKPCSATVGYAVCATYLGGRRPARFIDGWGRCRYGRAGRDSASWTPHSWLSLPFRLDECHGAQGQPRTHQLLQSQGLPQEDEPPAAANMGVRKVREDREVTFPARPAGRRRRSWPRSRAA